MGRSLALPNSFFLQFTNNSSSRQTFNLFNLGGSLQTQISTNQTLNTRKDIDLTLFIDSSGNVLATTTFELRASSAFGPLLKTATLSAGQNISLLNTALSPVVGTNGQTGYFSIAQQASPLQTFVDVVVGNANADWFNVLAFTGLYAQLVQTTASFVTTNPLVLVGGTIPYQEIENSETGNAYKVMGMDIYSNKSNQLLQGIQYGRKFVNGDRHLININPTIDPYQPSKASIQSEDSRGFTIDSNALFFYAVESFTFARLTFNYVRAKLSIMEDFDQAFVQQLTMESEKLQRILDSEERLNYLLFQ